MDTHVLEDHSDALHRLMAQRALRSRQLEGICDLVRKIAYGDALLGRGLVAVVVGIEAREFALVTIIG